jgi:DnaJ-class molecular chaperone
MLASMADSNDFYALLGVPRNASADDIRKAYRKLALKHHPDVSDAPDAAARFAEIQEAYDVLMDDEKRRAYDQFGVAGVRGGPGAGAGAGGYGPGGPFSRGGGGAGPGGVRFKWTTSGPGGAGRAQDFDIPDLGSIFEEMFGARGASPFGAAAGGGRAGGRTTARAAPPRRGRDVYHPITVPFMTAAMGGAETVRITRPTGESEAIEVRIPAGIDDGAKLRIRGRGNPGANGGEAGDVILTVRVGKHPYFKREGLDVLLDVPLSITEATLGATVKIPLLKGTAEVKVPTSTPSGSRLRIRGKGIAGTAGAAGDFHAVVQIVPPKPIPEDARPLIDELSTKLKNPRESAPWAEDLKG